MGTYNEKRGFAGNRCNKYNNGKPMQMNSGRPNWNYNGEKFLGKRGNF